jgi:hypothetical protein
MYAVNEGLVVQPWVQLLRLVFENVRGQLQRAAGLPRDQNPFQAKGLCAQGTRVEMKVIFSVDERLAKDKRPRKELVYNSMHGEDSG